MSHEIEWSEASVEMVPFSSIEIGERRREKLGPIAGLARSIEKNGLIHPIVITGEGVLVAGRRRLAAIEKLGWPMVPVRRFEDMSHDELRVVEIDENQQRLDLSDYELSKKMVEEAEMEVEEVSAEDLQKPSRQGGRPKGGTSASARALLGPEPKDPEAAKVWKRKVNAQREQIRTARNHVSAAEAHPVFQGKQWKRSQAIAASEYLESIPKRDHAVAIEMVTGPGIDTQSAVKMLETLAEKPAPERKAIIELYQSDDPAKKSLAFTRAIQLPPLPPKVLSDLDQAIRWVDKASERETPRASEYEAISKKLQELRGSEENDYERLKAAEAVR